MKLKFTTSVILLMMVSANQGFLFALLNGLDNMRKALFPTTLE